MRVVSGVLRARHHSHRTVLSAVGLLIAFVLTVTGVALGEPAQAEQPGSNVLSKTHAFVNGRWFDGHVFREDTFYTVDGRLTRNKPSVVDAVIDLAGGFVVPPFGEAHNHNVEGPWHLDAVVHRYLADGVFYVKNPNNIREFTAQILQHVNTPTSIDVVFANAGLTGSGGHPAPLYEHVLRQSRYKALIGDVPAGWFNNRGYVLIDRESDLHEKWEGIKAGKPDFLKVYLARSEDAAQHQQGTFSPGRKGLDPALLPLVVAKAHHDGLRVSAHVETAADFRMALASGVDELAHMPGWFLGTAAQASRMVLTEEDARLAARAGVVVVTTTVAMKPDQGGHAHHKQNHAQHGAHGASAHVFSMDATAWQQAREIQIRNLRLLQHHGVKLAIGSDHAETSLAEALHLHELGVFDNLTLLTLWCEQTPRAIFPNRLIGRLEEGYEASFLVLQGNPIEQFDAVTHMTFQMKDGRVLHLAH
jgi:imidazolonepropionase-like amidohydrolase